MEPRNAADAGSFLARFFIDPIYLQPFRCYSTNVCVCTHQKGMRFILNLLTSTTVT